MNSEGLTVKFKVKNIGEYDGKVVAMLFLNPDKVFKGFDKKLFTVGSISNFEILIKEHNLLYYDVDKADFVRPTSGQFTVYFSQNTHYKF